MPEEGLDNDARSVPAAPGHQSAPGSETVNQGHASNQLAVVSAPPVTPGDHLVVRQPAAAPNNQPTAFAVPFSNPITNGTLWTEAEKDTFKSIIVDDFGGKPSKRDWPQIINTFRQRHPPGRPLSSLRKTWYLELRGGEKKAYPQNRAARGEGKKSKAKQSKAKQSKAKQSKVKHPKAKQSKGKRSKASPLSGQNDEQGNSA